jgi:outer membrane murein-binding lipoprotein Lpp
MSIRALIAIVLMVSAASAGCVATQGDVSSVYARQTRLEARMDRLSRDMQSLNQKEATTSGTDVELREKVFQLEQNGI